MRKENESDQQDEAAASLPPDVEIKQEVMDEEDVVHVPSDDDVKPDAQDILLQENRKLQQKVKRLNVKLQQAKKEAEERIALSRLSRERLIDIIIDAKYHGGDL